MQALDRIKFSTNTTPYNAARKVGKALCAEWEMALGWACAFGPTKGGSLDDSRTDMTSPEYGSGYAAPKSAELCIEGGPDDWIHCVCDQLNGRFRAEGIQLSCEPSTSWALDFYRDNN